MRSRLRYGLFLAVVFGLFMHFVLTVIYCLPADKVGARASSYAGLYTYPAFHQGWALFAPDPQLQGKRMEFRYVENGEWGPWLRPDSVDYNIHTRFRLTHHSKRYHMMQNSAFYIWQEVEKKAMTSKSSKDYYPGTFGYEQANHFARKWHMHHIGWEEYTDSLQVRLVLTDPFALDWTKIDVLPTHSLE